MSESVPQVCRDIEKPKKEMWQNVRVVDSAYHCGVKWSTEEFHKVPLSEVELDLLNEIYNLKTKSLPITDPDEIIAAQVLLERGLLAITELWQLILTSLGENLLREDTRPREVNWVER